MNIIPAHFLTVPLHQFRESLDNIEDIHYVLKITNLGGKFTVEKYPIRANLDSKFCLRTSEMAGSSLCYITSGIFGFGSGPACKHSAIKTFHTVHDTLKCPQTDNALELYSICEGSQKTFENSVPLDYKYLPRMKWIFNIEPSLTTEYQLRVTLGNKTTEFDVSHEQLCKYNGVLPIGTLPSDYPQRDCKERNFCNKGDLT